MLFNARFRNFLLAALLAVPAAPAGAWDELCMHFPLGKTWFAGRFYLIHDFQLDGLKVPARILGEDFGPHNWRKLKARLNQLDALILEAKQSIKDAEALYFPWYDLEGPGKRKRAIKKANATARALIDERRVLVDSAYNATFRIRDPLYNADRTLTPAASKKSGTILAGQTRCISLRDVPIGAPFYVMVKENSQEMFTMCDTHSSNPHQWYLNQKRPYSRIEYQAWGHVWDDDGLHCRYNKEY